MASLGDAVVLFPVSGTLQAAYMRVAHQALSSSFSRIAHAGGNPVSVQILASNNSRQGLVLHNSGTQAFLLGYGTAVTSSSFSEKVLAFNTLTVKDPVYTGALFGMWDASGTFSGSIANITELTS